MSLGNIKVNNLREKTLEFSGLGIASKLVDVNLTGELTVNCNKTGQKKVYKSQN